MKSPRLLALMLLVTSCAGLASAQGRGGTFAGFSITGKVIVPVPSFQDIFEVVLVQNLEQTVQATVADSQGRYRFTGLARGTYYVTVKIEGFEEVRQRVDVGLNADSIVNIILDFKEEKTILPPVDFSGENTEVVNVSELTGNYPDEVIDRLESAEEDVRKRDFEKALSKLESVAAEAPDLYYARRLLGTVYQKMNRYRDAETEYRTAADLKPSSAAPLVNLGSLYLQEAEASQGRGSAVVRRILNEALGSLNAAVELKPDAAFAYYLLGVTYYRSTFYEEAEDHLLESLELEPRLADARLALANLYVKLQEWQSAISQLDRYLAENPRSTVRAEVENMRSRVLQRSQARLR